MLLWCNMGNRQIDLTQRECLFLSDAICAWPDRPGFGERSEGNGGLLQRILLGLLSFTGEPDEFSTVTIGCSDIELWVLHDTAKSSATMGNEKVGLSLTYKVAAALREGIIAEDMAVITETMVTTDSAAPNKAERAKQFERLAKRLQKGVRRAKDRHANKDKATDKPDAGAGAPV